MKHALREKLARGQTVVGCMMSVPSPELTEMLGHAGCDFVVIDLEHGLIDFAAVRHLVRAAECVGLVPLARISAGEWGVIPRLLDSGVRGIHLPHLQGPEDVAAVVQVAAYPGRGQRGLSFNVRAAGYGVLDREEYFRAAGESVFLVGYIEDSHGLANLSAILAAPGLDVVGVALTDMSQSLGVPGRVDHPLVAGAFARMAEQVTAAGLTLAARVGEGPYRPEAVQQIGARFLTFGCLELIQHNLCAEVKRIRTAADRR